VETVEKSLLLLDFSTVSMARHFHNESLVLCSSAPSPFFRPQIPPKTLKKRFFLFVVKNFRDNPFHEWYQDPLNGKLVFSRVEQKSVQINWTTKV
jgi:hypothetical protein